MPSELAILGAGGHAKVVISAARSAGYQVVAAFDDNPHLHGRTVLGVPIRGVLAAASESRVALVIGIGDNRVRAKVAAETEGDWATIVHPSATVDPGVQIEPGTVVFAGAVLQVHAVLGPHTVVNTSASVDHECRLEDCSQVGPGAHLGGNVHVGECAFVGLGASVIQGVKIGAHATVGAGAVVIHDVPPGQTVVGVPAKPI